VVTMGPDDGPDVNAMHVGRVQRDGTFTISNVPPGRYQIGARANAGDGSGELLGVQPITVSGREVAGVSLLLSPAATVPGVLTLDTAGMTPPPNLSQITISAPPLRRTILSSNVSTRPSTDGTFALRGLSPASHLVRVSGLPRPWSLKAVFQGRREITDSGFEVGSGNLGELTIVLTDRSSEVTVTTRDESGGPLADCTVIVFSTEPSLWRPQSRYIQAARADQAGQSRIFGLPAGNYFLAVVDDAEQGEWYDPAFLERIRPGAFSLSLADGEVKTQELRMSRLIP
jgi:hypothetical protein